MTLLGSLLAMTVSVVGSIVGPYWHDFDDWEDRTYACDITPNQRTWMHEIINNQPSTPSYIMFTIRLTTRRWQPWRKKASTVTSYIWSTSSTTHRRRWHLKPNLLLKDEGSRLEDLLCALWWVCCWSLEFVRILLEAWIVLVPLRFMAGDDDDDDDGVIWILWICVHIWSEHVHKQSQGRSLFRRIWKWCSGIFQAELRKVRRRRPC